MVVLWYRCAEEGIVDRKYYQQWRSCQSKIRHSNEEAARKHARHLGKPYHEYPCSFCNGWHVGRPNHIQRRRLAAQARKLRILRAVNQWQKR